MAGWTWAECVINAPAQSVFEYFADDTDKLSYLLPGARIVNILERERLPNGGQRIRLVLKVGVHTHEVVSEDVEFRPFTFMRGRTSGPAGTVDSEKRLSESNGRTNLVWGFSRFTGKWSVHRVLQMLAPASTALSLRSSTLGALARARAALEPQPQPQIVTEPAWAAARVPPTPGDPYVWVRWATTLLAWLIVMTGISLLKVEWLVLPNLALSFVLIVGGFWLTREALSWVALQFVPTRLPDSRPLT